MTNNVNGSAVLSMTLAMFDELTIQGVQNARIIVRIVHNLTELQAALKRAEANTDAEKKEAKTHDADNGQGQDV